MRYFIALLLLHSVKANAPYDTNHVQSSIFDTRNGDKVVVVYESLYGDEYSEQGTGIVGKTDPNGNPIDQTFVPMTQQQCESFASLNQGAYYESPNYPVGCSVWVSGTYPSEQVNLYVFYNDPDDYPDYSIVTNDVLKCIRNEDNELGSLMSCIVLASGGATCNGATCAAGEGCFSFGGCQSCDSKGSEYYCTTLPGGSEYGSPHCKWDGACVPINEATAGGGGDGGGGDGGGGAGCDCPAILASYNAADCCGGDVGDCATAMAEYKACDCCSN